MAGNYFQIASFYQLLNKNVARKVARWMLHCAMAKKFVASIVAKSRTDLIFYFVEKSRVTLPYTLQFTWNLFRNKMARHVNCIAQQHLLAEFLLLVQADTA